MSLVSFNVVDTAGVRETDDGVEKRGIDFSIAEIDRSDLVLGVFEKGDVGPLGYFRGLCSKNKKNLFQSKTK